MRKIEESMLQAINNRREFKSTNTKVEIDYTTITVKLYDNNIAVYNIKNDQWNISACNYNTLTTRSRLTALSEVIGNGYGGVCNRKGILHIRLNDELIVISDSERFTIPN